MEKAYSQPRQDGRGKTRRLAGVAIFTALVVILQLLGSFIRFGPFSISLVIVPIVIGAAVYGAWSGAWLGFVFGMVVLISGDAAPFLAVNPIGTVVTVLVKGALSGAAAGWLYTILEKKSMVAGAFASAVICPVVNTGIFLIGCLLFFLPTVAGWAEASGFGENVGAYMLLGLVGANFLIELLVDVVLCPVILRLIRIGKKEK